MRADVRVPVCGCVLGWQWALLPRVQSRGSGRVPSVNGICYPVLAWSVQLRAYAMPSVPVPPIMLT